jgi:protein subunit release factor B
VFNGFVPLDQLKITYDRSSGPGGQNVNKVNTKVDLRFNVKEASWISEKVKERLQEDVRLWMIFFDLIQQESSSSSKQKSTAKDSS